MAEVPKVGDEITVNGVPATVTQVVPLNENRWEVQAVTNLRSQWQIVEGTHG